MNYRWLLFDIDGTLFDYDRAEVEALGALWNELGLADPQATGEAYREINAALWRRFEAGDISSAEIKVERFRQLIASCDLRAKPEQLSNAYIRHLGRQPHLLADADRLIESAAKRYELGLITNGLAAVQRDRLARSPIGKHFDVVVISEEVGFAKPDPRIFEHAWAEMGNPSKDSVLMVGDNLVADIQGGNNFGLATCWFNQDGRQTNGHVRTTHEVQRLDQLLELLT